MKLNKNQYKDIIKTIEYYENGFDRLYKHSVSAKNIKIEKDNIIADIIFSFGKNNPTERINNCKYSKKFINEYFQKYFI